MSTPANARELTAVQAITAENRQLENLKTGVRQLLAWDGIVQDRERLNLTQRDLKLAEEKAKDAKSAVNARVKETWCYLLFPHQETPQDEVEWTSSKVPSQDGVLGRASKKLVSDEGLLPEFGPVRLESILRKHIWHDKPHLGLLDLWEYSNRYIYLPRLKNRSVLSKTVQTAISGLVPGPFAYAERYEETTSEYAGLAISNSGSVQVVIDRDSVIVDPVVAEEQRRREEVEPEAPADPDPEPGPGPINPTPPEPPKPKEPEQPKRFRGTVFIDPDRPARDMHQIVEAIIEQLTIIPGANVELKLEIDAEISSGLDRSKIRTLTENATTLGFVDKKID